MLVFPLGQANMLYQFVPLVFSLGQIEVRRADNVYMGVAQSRGMQLRRTDDFHAVLPDQADRYLPDDGIIARSADLAWWGRGCCHCAWGHSFIVDVGGKPVLFPPLTSLSRFVVKDKSCFVGSKVFLCDPFDILWV